MQPLLNKASNAHFYSAALRSSQSALFLLETLSPASPSPRPFPSDADARLPDKRTVVFFSSWSVFLHFTELTYSTKLGI